MPDGVPLYLDENVSEHVADALRHRGLDVLTVGDAAMLARSDEDQLAFAARIGRVLVTHDRGIRNTHWQHQPHHGILFVPQRTARSDVAAWIETAAPVLAPDELTDRLESYRP